MDWRGKSYVLAKLCFNVIQNIYVTGRRIQDPFRASTNTIVLTASGSATNDIVGQAMILTTQPN